MGKETAGAMAVRGAQHLLQVLDVGILLGSGEPVLSMPLALGDLATRLDQGATVQEGLIWFGHLLHGLAELASLGRVHRDIKTQNLLLQQRSAGAPPPPRHI
jgi:serine/threonine protein kinase